MFGFTPAEFNIAFMLVGGMVFLVIFTYFLNREERPVRRATR